MKRLLTKEVMAIVAIAMIAVLCTASAQAQDANDPNNDSLFDPNRILTFNITMDSDDWDATVAECPDGQCPYPHTLYPATLVCGDLGPMLVGIRRKNDIAEPNELDPQKVSIKMDINLYVPGQLFAGKKKLSLECGSMMSLVTEGLTWNLYKEVGIISSRAAWCKVYVNGAYKGVYANVEQVDKRFLDDHGLDDIANTGFLWKEHELLGEMQRTRELETSPFAFNWYPFDHPDDPNNPEVATPSDWLDQIQWRINIPDLLALAAVENFTANTDGAMQKMTNYWYYDWSTEPNDDPNFQQPRLYFPWDLDSTLRKAEIERGIIDQKDDGHIWMGLIEEVNESGVPFGYPTHQADYLETYDNFLNGPLELSRLIAIIDNIESVVGAEMDLDPYSQLIADINAAEEFQRIRDFLTDRTAYITAQLEALTPPPGIVLLDDGFEGTPWDANWGSPAAWLNDTTTYHSGAASAGADQTNFGDFTCNSLDASDANAIYIRFWLMKDSDIDAGDLLLYYYDGTSYNLITDLDTLGSDDEWLYYGDTITDSNYFVPNFQIRFNATPDDKKEFAWVDEVVITKEVLTPCDKANLDRIDPVNFKDYAILADDWRLTGSGLAGDIDANDVVNFGDLDWMFDYWLDDCQP